MTIVGEANTFTATGDNGAANFHSCPDCSSTVFYENDSLPDTIAVPLGAFDDPFAFIPTVSVWEERQHEWLEIAGDIEHID